MAHKSWLGKAILGGALAFFATLCLGAAPAEALQGVATQEINIHVTDEVVEIDDPEPNIPSTGHNGIGDGSGATPVLTIGAILVAAAGVAVVIARRIRSRNSVKIAHGKMPIIVPLVALGLTPLIALQPVSAAFADPTLELSSEVLHYSLDAGAVKTLDFDTTVIKDLGSTDYVLSAMSDNSNANIDFSINEQKMVNNAPEVPNDDENHDHDSSDEPDETGTATSVDTAGPLIFYNSAGTGETAEAGGDTIKHSLSVSVNAATVPGDYKVMMTYFVNTDDGETFNFTIDTRMTDTLDTDATHTDGTATTFAIPTSGYVGRDESHDYSWIIDWGDGTPAQMVSGISDDESAGIPHDYAVPGEYHIIIKSSGLVVSGWLNAFGFTNTSLGANAQANKNMFKSIDSQLTDAMRTGNMTYRFAYMFYGAKNAEGIPSWLFDNINVSYSENVGNMFDSTFANYAQNSTTAAIPSGLFDSIHTTSATDMSGMFTATFFGFANNSTTATIPSGLFDSLDTDKAKDVSRLFRDTFFAHAAASSAATIPAGLFDSVKLADGANANDLFGGTFYLYANNSTSGTIPSGLFATVDTSKAASIVGMFSGTFSNYARASSVGAIPGDLFASINTANIAELAYVFNGTFSAYAQNSNTTIPAGLFGAVNTSRATNVSSMFAGTFNGFANNSTVSTIPAGLFGAVNTANATNMSNLFRDTFSNYAGLSTVATIPSGLFDGASTAKAENVPGMFSGTFYFYGHVSPAAAIPAGLFDKVDLSKASNVYEMFYKAFDSFAYTAATETDINAIWGNANFAGKVTADNVSSFFNSTFSNVTRMTGTAQTFINTKLGGITPAAPAHTFATTAVSDLMTINANWR